MNNRILILGSMDEFVELVKKSKARGYYTVVCDGYTYGPAKKYADKSYDIDVRDVESIVAMCSEERINGILGSYSDVLFEQASIIANKAGLKWYISPDQLKFYREKNIAKSLLADLGIKVPKNIVIQKDFCDEELDTFSFPVVIKPINGYGSRGIFVVNSVEEIRDKYSTVECCSNMDGILVEEYSRGKEYNILSWVWDGIVYVLGVANREKTSQEKNRIPMLSRVAYPAKEVEIILPAARDVLQKFAEATGQREGALSMQFFFNNNEVEVCEIAGRFLAFEHEMITCCSGFNFEDLLLNYVYCPEKIYEMLKNHSPYFAKNCVGLYFMGKHGKTVADQKMAFSLANDEHVIDFQPFYEEGETVDCYGTKQYFTRYYLCGESRTEVDAVTKMFYDNFRIYDPNDEQIAYIYTLED